MEQYALIRFKLGSYKTKLAMANTVNVEIYAKNKGWIKFTTKLAEEGIPHVEQLTKGEIEMLKKSNVNKEFYIFNIIPYEDISRFGGLFHPTNYVRVL